MPHSHSSPIATFEPGKKKVEETHLNDLTAGEKAIIRRLEGGKQILARLAALGFTPGTPLTIERRSDHGPILVALRGSRVALGQEEAAHILVAPPKAESTIDRPARVKTTTIALAGQPNVGKSTVFNLLTGMNQHVGNWSGKTVDLKSGIFTYKGETVTVFDLPGTYSLTANSEEERLAREFIILEHPNLIIAVVDAATLERNLYLVAELLLLPVPVMIALNMIDVAEQEGIHIEPKVLESALGVPVVPMSASHGQGITELQEAVFRMLNHTYDYQPKRPSILPAHQAVLNKLKGLIASYVPPVYPVEWVALKLLEGDEELTSTMEACTPPESWEQVHALLYQHEDAILDIAGARYEWTARMIRAAVVEPKITRVGLTARLDKVLTHPIAGTLALIAILGVAFWLTYAVGSPIQHWLSQLVSLLASTLRTGWPSGPHWLVEFLAGGLLGGIGMVLTFLPILVIFFAILGFMEDTGYMGRAAYLTDRWMHLMGLHGKSFLPILLGFGCNVPAVMGTRIIESRRARLLTILLIPLVPCTARMAVVAVLASLFFQKAAFWVSWGLIGGNLVLLAVLGLTLHHFFFEDEHVPFIMELPLYHLPNFKTIGIYIWQNITGFVQKAGTIILYASLVVWALSYFPYGNVSTSILASVGRFLAPVGLWMGLPWPMLLALITSFVAKENTIATLGILYGGLATLPSVITPAAALAFLVFQMLFIPCVGTVAAIRQETRSLKWTATSVGIMFGLSLFFAVLVYQVGRRF
jgi:ferrous iron transport protein B